MRLLAGCADFQDQGVISMRTSIKLNWGIPGVLALLTSLFLVAAIAASAHTVTDKRKVRPARNTLSVAEIKKAEARLAELGYGAGRIDGVIDDVTRNALIAFQKYQGREVTGRLGREDFAAIMNATAPQARDAGYKHVEVDLDRQLLVLTDDDGMVKRVLPVSTGSNRHYSEKG